MTSTIDISTPDKPLVIVTRELDAPRKIVWKAITDPRHIARWYGGPGFTNPVCEVDLRPGGLWHHVMQAPDGSRFIINSVFEEIIAPERLVWRTIKDPDLPSAPPTSINTVTLEDLGARTRWKLVAFFDSISDRDRSAKMGFANMVAMGAERLAQHLSTITEDEHNV